MAQVRAVLPNAVIEVRMDGAFFSDAVVTLLEANKVEAELLEAEEWYAERNRTAARAFVREITASLERILAAPRRWPEFEHNTHRIILRRFPYSIVYRTKPNVVEVVAVAQHSRRPGYWRGR